MASLIDLSNLSLNPNPITYDVSYSGLVYAFYGTGGFTMDQCFNTIQLLPEAQLYQYDVTQAVQVLFDVRTFNSKLGLYKDDNNQYITSTTFDISSDSFTVDSINISSLDFQDGLTASQVISVGTYNTMYTDYIEFVNTYFGYAGGFSSLFAAASEFDINQGVFDSNSFVNLLYPYSDVSGENVKPLTGSITISNINNLLRYAVDSNVFNNRNPATANIVDASGNPIEPGSTIYDTYSVSSVTDGSGNASDICGNVVDNLQGLYASNYGTADGFVAGDLFFIPAGTTIKLHIVIDAEISNPLNNTGSTNVLNLISKQDFTSKYGTTSANYFTESSTASIRNIDRTLTAPLLIKLANLSSTEGTYTAYDSSFNSTSLPIRHYMDSPYRQYTGGALNNASQY